MSYEVQPGDTLEGVALKNGVRVSQLRNLNRLYSSKLCPGQTLLLRRDSADKMTMKNTGETGHSEETEEDKQPAHEQDEVDRGSIAFPSESALMPEYTSREGATAVVPEVEETMLSEHGSSENLSNHPLWHEVNSFVNLSELAPSATLRERTFSDTAAMLGLDWAVPVVFNWLGTLVDGGLDEQRDAYFFEEVQEEPHDQGVGANVSELCTPPLMLGKHEVLTPSKAQQLRQVLPSMVYYDSWCLLYSLLNDGADLVSFLRLCRGIHYTLLVVQTEQDELFGGFTCSSWELAKEFCKYFMISLYYIR